MTKRLIGQSTFTVYSDTEVTSSPKDVAFSDTRKYSDEGIQDWVVEDRNIAASGVLTLDFNMTSEYLFIFCNGEVSVKFNGGAESITFTDFFSCRGEFTEIEITNTSADTSVQVKVSYGA